MIKWDFMIKTEPQPQLVLYTATVLLPIVLTRGDMAKLYDALIVFGRENPLRWPWKRS